jgi:hypothetical protein
MGEAVSSLGKIVYWGALFILGCDDIGGKEQSEYKRIQKTEAWCSVLEDDINYVVETNLFNDKVMDYKTFMNVSGLERRLPMNYDEFPLSIDVRDISNDEQIGGERRVLVRIPLKWAGAVRANVEGFRLNYIESTKFFGVGPLIVNNKKPKD